MLTIAGGIILGFLGIVVVSNWLWGEPKPQRPRPLPPPRVLTMRQYELTAEDEIANSEDPAEGRRNFRDLGFTLACTAASMNMPFEQFFDSYQRSKDADFGTMHSECMLAAFAADTMPALTWPNAQAKMNSKGAWLEVEINSWRSKRLDKYLGYRIFDWAEVSKDPYFGAYARALFAWTQQTYGAAPPWWDRAA